MTLLESSSTETSNNLVHPSFGGGLPLAKSKYSSITIPVNSDIVARTLNTTMSAPLYQTRPHIKNLKLSMEHIGFGITCPVITHINIPTHSTQPAILLPIPAVMRVPSDAHSFRKRKREHPMYTSRKKITVRNEKTYISIVVSINIPHRPHSINPHFNSLHMLLSSFLLHTSCSLLPTN